ncbi:MAG: pyruvate:ferredoxin (flavodoxin) oxidoreductase [Treponemataceae bacterium]
MSEKNLVMIDGNTAAGQVAHSLSEVIAIYPITPSSPMGEVSDELSARGKKNIWGTVPEVVELQSEAGAAGAVHGALTTGALSSTFTASQGLLLMIPNMYKIAGELTSTVFHIAARAVAASALSIFGDHQDVMACRQTGWAMLSSNSVQEVMDLAVISHAATLKSRIPFLHFFDGFRTSHEVQKIEEVSTEIMRKMISDELVREHRARGLTPQSPSLRGTAQNPDVYFQGREAVNKYYEEVPSIVQGYMDDYAKLTGRQYHLFDYYGAKDADKVIILMGSAADTVEETVDALNAKGEKTGLLKVRLYRPFSAEHFVKALPATVKAIAVLDRTKEPGSLGEPLYEDIRTAIGEMQGTGKCPFKDYPLTLGGRYGLGSKEFTPAMVKAVFDNLSGKKINHFVIGIDDDVQGLSLSYDKSFHVEEDGMSEALFYGLGSDGTVGANKNSIKIIGDDPSRSAQAYFVYDSKKSGTMTASHLRFGKSRIRKPYLITQANFIACHKFAFLETYDMLEHIKKGGTFLLTSAFSADKVWDHLPAEVQKHIIEKEIKFYVIDAMAIAEKAGMGSRINVVMQTAYFKISGVLPEAEAITLIKKAIEKTYGKKGADVVEKNIKTIDMALAGVQQVNYPKTVSSKTNMKPAMLEATDPFIKNILGAIAVNKGDSIKVSEMPVDGTFPTATTKWEKRGIAEHVPTWNQETCIQCGNCTVVCPHAVIRFKNVSDAEAAKAPKSFKLAEIKPKPVAGVKTTLCVSVEDCTGCGVCVEICPAKEKHAIQMKNYLEEREAGVANWKFFESLPDAKSTELNLATAKGLAYKRPLFEFSGACAGCGETPYVKMLTQMFGDRAVIANATGCSSIYGGNLPSTPYAKNADGHGPAWSNSLFEDAAEFGYGMRLTSDKLAVHAREVAQEVKTKGIASAIIDKLLSNTQADDAAIEEQKANVEALKAVLKNEKDNLAQQLCSLADHFIKRSVWVLGGDGWAYDIGFGGLDHVIASGRNINLLVMDTEVYSNTGGQMSKATPIGAVAKFAAAGKPIAKKDLGAIARSYGYVYVAQISMGANMAQTIKAFREAESYDGPSIIIAYSTCINHGINMTTGMTNQKEIVSCGLWPLYRYDPRLVEQEKNPFQLDSKEPDYKLADFMYKEVRFKTLKAADPSRAESLLKLAETKAKRQYQELKYLAERNF